MSALHHVSRTVSELAAHVGGEVLGDGARTIRGINALAEAGPDELSFYGNPKYRKDYEATRAGAVLVLPDAPTPEGRTVIRVAMPHLAFAKVTSLLFPSRRPAAGVHPRAVVHPDAVVHREASILANAVVEAGAHIGARTVLHPGVYVGEGAHIGEDCVLYPNVTLREGCRLGDRVILQANAVIGADGFGFAFDPGAQNGPEHYKVPQVGIVRIEDDVEIGAGTCVDRATFGETVIGRGTKIDNLVQIAHNVQVGPLSIICAQAGVSGSAQLGTGVLLAGQVGVVGHIKVGDLARVGAQSGVAQSVPDGATLSGSPAIPHRQWLKNVAAQSQLSELVREVRQLRRQVDELKGRKDVTEDPRG